jgi:hypothetical protein
MELTNLTPYSAGIARMVYGEDRIAASVLVRVTYDIKNGKLVPSEGQPWIVSQAPWEGPQGLMAGDHVFYKGGVDVHLFGRAVPEGGSLAPEVEVEIRIGTDFRRHVRVFGARVWHRRLGGLVPTPPRPFSSLPLTLSHAYGGKDTWDGLEIPCVENPEGLGFYAMEESAVDHPLPFIEEPGKLIQRWDDRPDPAGLGICPPTSPLHAKRGVTVTSEQQARILPLFFNTAFAPMIARSIAGGAPVFISGVSERGPLQLRLPEHRFSVRLRFGTEVHDLPLAIDQVGIEVDESRAFIAYRAPFRYVVHELQARSCELTEQEFQS